MSDPTPEHPHCNGGCVGCPEKPEALAGQPIGQYHCPYCMMMVVAAVPHPTCSEMEAVLSQYEGPRSTIALREVDLMYDDMPNMNLFLIQPMLVYAIYVMWRTWKAMDAQHERALEQEVSRRMPGPPVMVKLGKPVPCPHTEGTVFVDEVTGRRNGRCHACFEVWDLPPEASRHVHVDHAIGPDHTTIVQASYVPHVEPNPFTAVEPNPFTAIGKWRCQHANGNARLNRIGQPCDECHKLESEYCKHTFAVTSYDYRTCTTVGRCPHCGDQWSVTDRTMWEEMQREKP